METIMAVSLRSQVHNDEQLPIEQMNSRITANKKKKLFMENYLAFIHSPDLKKLNCEQLKQIMSIRGFRLVQTRKSVEEAVAMITPIDPSRSTLNSVISSEASMKLEEVIKDLAALNWQECCVTSIRSFNSVVGPLTTGTRSTTPNEDKIIPATSLNSSAADPTNSKSFSDEAGPISQGGNSQLNSKRKRRAREKLLSTI